MTADERQGDDVSAAADERLAGLVELARRRRESRRVTRERMARRRDVGLERRHKSKLDRTEET